MIGAWDFGAAVVAMSMLAGVALHTLWAVFARRDLRFERVEKQGTSVFLGRDLMNAGYAWMLPMGRFLARRGVSPDVISLLSLALGLAAGILLALDLPGWAGLMLVIAGAADVIDGMVARLIERTSRAGVVLDSSLDRYVDFFILAGIAVAWRASPVLLCTALAAIIGSFMISYSTAKAEAMDVEPPRGSMKRSERYVLLVLGILFTGLAPPFGYGAIPLIAVVALIAVMANVSAARRIAALYRAADKLR